jgi:hypothetical protein
MLNTFYVFFFLHFEQSSIGEDLSRRGQLNYQQALCVLLNEVQRHLSKEC